MAREGKGEGSAYAWTRCARLAPLCSPSYLPSTNVPFPLLFLQVKKAIDADQSSIKLIFLCSPGNPTGTLISLASIRAILEYEPFKGIVVVDEAYIDFAEPGSSAASLVAEYANICVMQTLSKSFGLAAIRCVSESPFLFSSSPLFLNAVPPLHHHHLCCLRADSASRSPNHRSSRSSRIPKHPITFPRRRPTLHYALCLLHRSAPCAKK